MIQLREFRWPDIAAATAIERANFPHDTWSAESFWNELAAVGDTAHYVAAEEDDQLIGYAGIALIDTDSHVQTISVHPDFGGRGIGRLLLEQILQFAQEQGAHQCLLEVRTSNEAALRLYRAYGFAELGERKNYYPDGEDALVLCRAFDVQLAREPQGAARATGSADPSVVATVTGSAASALSAEAPAVAHLVDQDGVVR